MATNKDITDKQESNTKGKRVKAGIRRWIFRLVILAFLLVALLVGAVLQPGLFYHHKSIIGRLTIYHSDSLDSNFLSRLQEAIVFIEKSEVYDPSFSFDICVGESTYPKIIARLFGDAFAWGFYNKVVIKGRIDSKNNVHESNWNLSKLLAHEMTHCLQFNKLGLLKSNPLAGYPQWKWEGYPEYVVKKDPKELLVQSIGRLVRSKKVENAGFTSPTDSLRPNRIYYTYWLLVRYWLETRKKTYSELLKDTTSEESITREMISWYETNQ